MDNAQITEDLNRLAARFEANVQKGPAGTGFVGWGQFLDAFKEHEQLGPYGTASGVIVLALAGRGESHPLAHARNLLAYWWSRRNDTNDHAHKQYAQTLRLAFHHLALRLSDTPADNETMIAIRSALLDRLLPSGEWGNYWTNMDIVDPTPRLFPTAIALLSFSLMHNNPETFDRRIVTAAEQLESKLELPRALSRLESSAIAAALLATRGRQLSRNALKKIARMARRILPELKEQDSYFFDFEFLPNQEGKAYARDFFIVSPEILLALAGFQRGAPAGARLMAERTVEALDQNLQQNDHAYRAIEGGRFSTVDQAWAAILLRSASTRHQSTGVASKIWYWLSRERKENLFTGTLFPISSMVIMTVLNVISKNLGLLMNILTTVGVLFIASLYGPRYFRRLFPGRGERE